jgi:hypothetical protein
MGRKILLLSLVVVCSLAIGCGVPSSSQTASDNLEAYEIYSNPNDIWNPPQFETMMLETKGSWEGNAPQTIHFYATQSPWVLNARYEITSQIESHFNINARLASETDPFAAIRHIDKYWWNSGWVTFVGTTTGDFIIAVDSSGCEWQVRIGVEPPPTPPSEATVSAILGKWRHGLPEECPPQMSQQQYEELKELPESKTYYLGFFEDGEVQFICEGQIIDGTYTFISDDEVEISWNVLGGALAEFFDSHGVYKIEFSEDNMALQGGLEASASYLRVD